MAIPHALAIRNGPRPLRPMMTANPTAPTDLPFESAASRHHRRSRHEVEALAKNFVATPVEEVPPPAKPRLRLAAAGGVALLTLLTILFWPRNAEVEAARPAVDTSRAAAEAEQWRQRYEAERERKRQELKAGSDYMAKMAAADATLMKDMSAQAELLARRVAAAPAPAAAEREPTPRDEPIRTASAQPAPSKAASPSRATTTAGAAPAPASAPARIEPAPQQQVAKAAPAQSAPVTTAAAASSCSIHVSELSKSRKLTYADIARMKGARMDARTQHVFTPPVQTVGGRSMVFEVMPSGCVRMVRQ